MPVTGKGERFPDAIGEGQCLRPERAGGVVGLNYCLCRGGLQIGGELLQIEACPHVIAGHPILAQCISSAINGSEYVVFLNKLDPPQRLTVRQTRVGSGGRE